MKNFRESILQWYDIEKKNKILCISDDDKSIPASWQNEGADVEYLTISDALVTKTSNQYDIIVCTEDFERCLNVKALFKKILSLLTLKGRLFLLANNRLGLRYFCGDIDPYTRRNFTGIENYPGMVFDNNESFCGRMYSKNEVRTLLRETGFSYTKFYAVMPNLNNPFLFYAEGVLPNENLAARIQAVYNSPSTIYLKEETLYDTIINNDLFHSMANAYLIECSLDGNFSGVQHITCSVERSRENAMFTIIYNDKHVEKKAISPEGKSQLIKINENMKDLAAHGIKVVTGHIDGDKYVMPYMNAETGHVYLRKLFLSDKEKFLTYLDKFRDEIIKSSDIVSPDKGDGMGATLARGYFDLVPLNSFYIDGEFVFFDQEFCYNNFPANAIIYRMIRAFYAGNGDLERIMPQSELFERYDLNRQLPVWQKLDREFLHGLRNVEKLQDYHARIHSNDAIVTANRDRMNIPALIYDKHIRTMLDKADTRKLILFGAGKYAESFLMRFGRDYPIYAIIDNNKARHGVELGGVKICSPDILQELSVAEYKVIICVKNYAPIAEQLEKAGIHFYGIYYPAFNYSFSHRLQKETANGEAKKYHIGYIAGVFDLYHIGHLNMFRRDRQVREGKKVEPFVPFEEREKMVAACKYVDEVVAIPFEHPDTDYAWERYRFDVQFSGSDYEHDPVWLKKKKWLEERGATMVFFPYTQTTSSTKIKKLIEERLM